MSQAVRRSTTGLVLLACLGQLLVVLDISIVNVALPAMRTGLGFSDASLQWVVNAYTIAFAGCVLLGGRLADLFGARAALIGGLALFSLASLVGGFAQSPGLLLGGRALQGLGAALLSPVTLTLLTTRTAPGPERAKAIALWGAVSAAGGAIGAVTGGVLVDTLSWRWVLFVNVPLGLLGIVAALRVLPASAARPAAATRRPDVAGAVTVTAGLAALVYGVVGSTAHGWVSTEVLVPVAAGLALLALFAFVELRVAAEPLVPFSLFRVPGLASGNLVGLVPAGAYVAMWYFVTLYQQEVLGMSAIAAGCGFLPHTLSIIVASRIAGRLMARVDPRQLMVGGLLLSAVGFALQAQAGADGSYLADVLLPGVLICFGAGLYFPPQTQVATAGVPPEAAGLASGIFNTSRWFGGALGLAALVTVAASRTDALSPSSSVAHAMSAGFDRAFVVSAVSMLVAAVLVPLLPRPNRDEPALATTAEAVG